MAEKCALEGCVRSGKIFLYGRYWCCVTHAREANGLNGKLECNGTNVVPIARATGRVPMSDRRH